MSRDLTPTSADDVYGSIESADLRRCVRDLVALTALPAVWVGYRPLKMAENLADALLTMLRLDFVYVHLTPAAHAAPQSVLRFGEGSNADGCAESFTPLLSPLLSMDKTAATVEIEFPSGDRVVRATTVPLGRARHGVLIAGSRRQDFPTEVDRLLLGVGANQAAILLDRQRAEGETQKARAAAELHATQLNSVSRATVAIASAATLKEALQAVTEASRHITGAHQSAICLGRPAEGAPAISSISVSEKYGRLQGQNALPNVPEIYAEVCNNRGPIRLTTAELKARSELSSSHLLEQPSLVLPGMVAVPLVDHRGQNIGLLQACDKYEGEFTVEDESILTQIGQVAVAAIERERLLENEREARSEAEVLLKVGKAISSELDLNRLVQAATDAATELCGAGFGAFFYNVITDKGESYTLYTLSGTPRENFSKFPMPRNTDIFAPTFRGAGVVRLDDVTKDSRYGRNTPYQGMPPGHLPVRSYLAVPVVSRDGGVLGGMFFGHAEAGRFNDRHDRIATGIASQAAVAIDNARLYEAAKATRAETERSLSQLQAVVESMTEGLVIADPQGAILTMNSAALLIHEFKSTEELLAKLSDYPNLFELQDADGHVLPVENWPLSRVLRGERFTGYEIRVRRRDSGKTWIGSYGGTPVLNPQGHMFLAVLTVRDVTDQKCTQAALVESEAKFRQLADAIPQLAWMAKPDGWIFWYNDQWHRYTGTTPQQMEGWGWQSVHDPKMLPSVMERWQASINTGQPFEMEFPLRSASGEFRWFLTRVNPLRGSDGKILLWFGTNTDVSEQRKQQEALAASEARLRAVVEATPECVKIVAPDGSLSYMNPAGLCMIEADVLPSVSGASVPSLIGTEYREQWQANHRRVCAGEKLSWEFEIVGLRGTRRWMETHAVPLPLPDGRTAQLAVTRDITQRKEAEQQRESLLESERAARAEAERVSRMKDEFLSTLSHELRTPLNAILGWSQILRASSAAAGSDDDLSQGLATIERNARNQAQIIEDLLDMSRIISGKVRLDVQRIDLPAVIEAALLTAKPGADAKDIRLQPVLDPHAGPVSGDPNRLQQVFWNLLSNAVKFTPRGGRIQVLLERVNSHLEVSVIDSGEGIQPDFLPFVFDRFRQADASTTRKHGGLGLGLAIVKQLVELHGGTVRAKSAGVGKGSTFLVTLPLTVVHPDATPQVEQRHPTSSADGPSVEACQSLEGVRVLVVDDEPDARALVERLLTDCKAVVVTAGSADDAIGRLQREKFDVLVSDIGMPGEDGYSLIRRIRKLDAATAQIPAVALTAYARSEDRQRAILAGFHLHVAKPVEPSELITMVSSLASRRGAGG